MIANMVNKVIFNGYKGWFLLIKMSFSKNKRQSFIMFISLMLLSAGFVGINYVSNILSGNFTDSLVSKNYHEIVKFLIILIAVHIFFAVTYAAKDYIDRKLEIILKSNLYYAIGPDVLDDTKCDFSCQRMQSETACFITCFSRLSEYAIRCILYFPIFIVVLYKIGGYKMILFAICYSIFGQIISKYLSDRAYPYGYKLRNMNSDFFRKLIDQARRPSDEKRVLPDIKPIVDASITYYKKERLLDLFRDIFSEMKGYLPYLILLTPYMQGTITLGDTVRAISAFRYIMQSIGFFTDNRMNLLQFSMSINRLNELINIKKV